MANAIHAGKGFEYFVSQGAATVCSRYLDLVKLDAVTKKPIEP